MPRLTGSSPGAAAPRWRRRSRRRSLPKRTSPGDASPRCVVLLYACDAASPMACAKQCSAISNDDAGLSAAHVLNELLNPWTVHDFTPSLRTSIDIDIALSGFYRPTGEHVGVLAARPVLVAQDVERRVSHVVPAMAAYAPATQPERSDDVGPDRAVSFKRRMSGKPVAIARHQGVHSRFARRQSPKNGTAPGIARDAPSAAPTRPAYMHRLDHADFANAQPRLARPYGATPTASWTMLNPPDARSHDVLCSQLYFGRGAIKTFAGWRPQTVPEQRFPNRDHDASPATAGISSAAAANYRNL